MSEPTHLSAVPASVSARAYGKVNLYLGVGDLRPDGYHELINVFQSLNIPETVTMTPADDYSLTITGRFADAPVPLDESNLAFAAVRALVAAGAREIPVAIEIEKDVPVAGGMGGGSADAAAALLAYKRLSGWQDKLMPLAVQLGADVPFALTGGTAVGTGRGDELTPLLSRGSFHWVIATSTEQLSTPAVFRKLDELRAGTVTGLAPHADTQPGTGYESDRGTDQARVQDVLAAASESDPQALAAAVHNDMEAAAVSLAPGTRAVIKAGLDAGALAALLSGSGPTVAFLVGDSTHALDLAVMLEATPGVRHVLRTTGPAPAPAVLD